MAPHYGALARTAQRLSTIAEEARVAVAAIREPSSSLRSSSRAPLLARHLAGFGGLRSDQIERILGVSRAGVHGIIASLRTMRLVVTKQVSKVKLHALKANISIGEHVRSAPPTPWAGLSTSALDEFDDVMKAIDAILTNKQDAD